MSKRRRLASEREAEFTLEELLGITIAFLGVIFLLITGLYSLFSKREPDDLLAPKEKFRFFDMNVFHRHSDWGKIGYVLQHIYMISIMVAILVFGTTFFWAMSKLEHGMTLEESNAVFESYRQIFKISGGVVIVGFVVPGMIAFGILGIGSLFDPELREEFRNPKKPYVTLFHDAETT